MRNKKLDWQWWGVRDIEVFMQRFVATGRGSAVATKQEFAESLAISRGNARADNQCNELMVDKGARGTSKAKISRFNTPKESH